MVYYLEHPYGHLMQDIMGNAEGRTKVKGNLFSFPMPWGEVRRCCEDLLQQGEEVRAAAQAQLKANTNIPHSEETLALLVSVKIVSGEADIASKLN